MAYKKPSIWEEIKMRAVDRRVVGAMSASVALFVAMLIHLLRPIHAINAALMFLGAMVASLAFAYAGFRWLRYLPYETDPGFCPSCTYDLSGHLGWEQGETVACPECGTVGRKSDRPTPLRFVVTLPGVALLIAGVILTVIVFVVFVHALVEVIG